MLLKILDLLECPACNKASRIWKLDGEVTETRITNGKVICPEDHSWSVKEEILRFDEQNDGEEMQFLDHPRTGFPKPVGEKERFNFLDSFGNYVKSLEFGEDEIVKLRGDSILFMKYVKDDKPEYIICHPNEGILRQLQETAARKRMYDSMAFVRVNDVNTLGNVISINNFDDEIKNDDIAFLLTKKEKGKVLWEGSKVNLEVMKKD